MTHLCRAFPKNPTHTTGPLFSPYAGLSAGLSVPNFLVWGMAYLEQIDWTLFFWINRDWDHPILNSLLPAITDLHKQAWFFWIVLPLIGFFLYRKYQRKFWKPYAVILVAIASADGVGGQIIKPLFARPRPNLQVEDVILRAPHYGGFSLPSNHAINLFCAATLLGFIFPHARVPLFLIAGVVAISRVYVGVHFPSDVILGAAFGVLWSYLFILLFRGAAFTIRSPQEKKT